MYYTNGEKVWESLSLEASDQQFKADSSTQSTRRADHGNTHRRMVLKSMEVQSSEREVRLLPLATTPATLFVLEMLN